MFHLEVIDGVAAIWPAADAIAWGQFARLRGAERKRFLAAALLGLVILVVIIASRLLGII